MASIYEFTVDAITDEPVSMAAYRGKVLLIVNVASQCGLTPQYEALQKLYSEYQDKGLSVLGFPANDFGAQEPGSNHQIAEFCESKFGVKFPMFSKISVTGAAMHPLYSYLVEQQPTATGPNRAEFRQNLEGFLAGSGLRTNPEPGILWNFEKFLVGRDGKVIGRFSPEVTPDDAVLIERIQAALAA